MNKLTQLAVVCTAFLLAACSGAPAAGTGTLNIKITDAWLKALPGMAMDQQNMPTPEPTKSSDAARVAPPDLPIYMIITNTSNQADRLVKAETSIAKRTELHDMIKGADGKMKMQQVPSIDIAAGQAVTLKTGSLHIMVFGVTPELKVGDKITATLYFEHAGAMPVQVEVREPK